MNPTIISINKCSAINELGVPVTEDPYGGSAVNQCSIISPKSSFKNNNGAFTFKSCILPNIEFNNGMTVFIPVGYSPILICEDDMKKLKTIIEIPELNIRVLALILNNIKRPQNAFLLFRNEILAVLLNRTFGNAIELIISIIALTKGQIRIVQASVLGSVLSNILVVLGSCFLFGGITILKEGCLEQKFDSTVAQASSSVMTLACIALIVPAAFSLANDVNSNNTLGTTDSRILNLSYGSSVALFLKTHKDLFQTDENEELQISKYLALFLLVTVTVVTAFSAEFLVSSIEEVVTSHGLSKTFIGLVLLPIIGNAAEHATSVKIAIKDRIDFAISVAVGSSTQIALFVTPLLVILGWIIGQPMSLFFLPFEIICLFIAVLLSNYLVQIENQIG
ncbi:calcium/proton exchanger [Gigaspora margarita]|uniref:Vacuolar calcium ion transporter n=1 Tax=Gigaspora margarita TaxID=4874 RepID=A0A8H3WWG7_GIGMA|nr:calcium/proton exchanger [Gigaspora margarita]